VATAVEETKTIEVNHGAQLEVATTGAGDPLVLICGTSHNRRLWAPFLPVLSGGCRVITYDHRGMGESTRGSGPMAVSTLAEDLHELLNALGLERVHLLGYSLGSAVAQEFALAHPGRVGSLVLAATWARTDGFQRAVMTALAHPWRTGDRDAALTALGMAFSPELLNSAGFAEQMAQLGPAFASTDGQMATTAEQWDADLAHDTLSRLGAITAPALVIAGEQDLITPPCLGRVVADSLPAGRFHLLTGPGSSHGALLERAEEFLPLVLEFLAEYPLGRAG
jgi:pimeloyl-ACP methyl ester carboxylesterase